MSRSFTTNVMMNIELQKNPVEGFSAGLVDDSNLFEWEVFIVGPSETLFEGGFFKATLSFPEDYPNKPPVMTFTTPMWHPNVYSDGKVCISILHPPGDDEYGYEKSSERWLPIHSVESILLSVISMLSAPNDESPANLDAAKQWREDKQAYKRKVRVCSVHFLNRRSEYTNHHLNSKLYNNHKICCKNEDCNKLYARTRPTWMYHFDLEASSH